MSKACTALNAGFRSELGAAGRARVFLHGRLGAGVQQMRRCALLCRRGNNAGGRASPPLSSFMARWPSGKGPAPCVTGRGRPESSWCRRPRCPTCRSVRSASPRRSISSRVGACALHLPRGVRRADGRVRGSRWSARCERHCVAAGARGADRGSSTSRLNGSPRGDTMETFGDRTGWDLWSYELMRTRMPAAQQPGCGAHCQTPCAKVYSPMTVCLRARVRPVL
jgi:hypothetical protein